MKCITQKTTLKSLLAATILATSLPTQAADFASIVKSNVGGGHSPTRFVKVRLQAVKLYKEKQADGTYQSKAEKVCDKVGEAPVFDLRSQSAEPGYEIQPIECETKLKSGNAKLRATSFVMISDNVDVFGDGERASYKMYGQSFQVSTDSQVYSSPFNYVMSDDFNQKSMIQTTYGDRFGTDRDGDAVLDERFTVIMKTEEK